jgi:phage gp29-like protein
MAKSPRTNTSSKASRSARPELDTEFANRLLDPFETAYMGVLRTNDPLLLERGNGGVQLYRDLKRDGKVFDGLQKRQLALIGKPWQVQPVDNKAPAATEDAEKLTAILKACSFDRICSELLEALIAGYAVAEIVWTVRDNMVVPARVVKRAQRRFVYVQKDENSAPVLHLLTRDNMLTGKPVPEKKFIVHRVNPEDDNPYGTGLGLQLYWPVFFKRKGIVAWNKLCDRFGSPTPHGKYPRGSGPKEKSTLADALRAMSSDGYLMTPEGMEIALLESKLSGNVTTQQALCEYMDDWIGAVLTGQEARSSGGGALAAAATERQDVRQDLTQADSDLLSETLNETLVAWICEYNGLAPCQVYRQIKAEDDVKAMAEADKVVSDMGFELDVDTVRAKYGEGWSKKAAAEPGGAPSPAPSPGPARDKTPNFSEVQSRDALDHLVDDALGDWEPLMSPVAAQLQALLNDAASKGETAQQLLDRLPQLLAELNVAPLQEDLARTAFAARLGANAGLENT